MKQETKDKIQRKWMRAKQVVKEWAPWIAIGTVGGCMIGGYVGAIDNSIEIGKINKRLNRHAEVIDHNADCLDNRTNDLRERSEALEKQVEELQRQNNLLMEKALQNGR